MLPSTPLVSSNLRRRPWQPLSPNATALAVSLLLISGVGVLAFSPAATFKASPRALLLPHPFASSPNAASIAASSRRTKHWHSSRPRIEQHPASSSVSLQVHSDEPAMERGIDPPFTVTLEGDDYSYRDAIQRTLGWVGAAIIFGGGIWSVMGSTTGQEFFAGYLVEQSLSVDNLFVFLLLFEYFKVPLQYQDRVLNWGIYGAVVMRAVMIGIGAAAIHNFHAILLVFAAILIYGSGKFFFEGEQEEEEDPSQNAIVQFSKSLFPSTDDFHGNKFFTVIDGVRMATPLFICLVAVEISDVVFAVDSIPAVFGVTEVRSQFVAFDGRVSVGPRTHLNLHPLYCVCFFRYAESADCLFFQHLCHYGPSESVHNLVQSRYRPQVFGTCRGMGTRVYWCEDGIGILWIQHRHTSGAGCRCDGTERWRGSIGGCQTKGTGRTNLNQGAGGEEIHQPPLLCNDDYNDLQC